MEPATDSDLRNQAAAACPDRGETL